MALAAVQVHTGLDLHTMEPSFSMANDPDMHEDLIDDFDGAAEAIVDTISAQDGINNVFD